MALCAHGLMGQEVMQVSFSGNSLNGLTEPGQRDSEQATSPTRRAIGSMPGRVITRAPWRRGPTREDKDSSLWHALRERTLLRRSQQTLAQSCRILTVGAPAALGMRRRARLQDRS
jgi:hypothetical protein